MLRFATEIAADEADESVLLILTDFVQSGDGGFESGELLGGGGHCGGRFERRRRLRCVEWREEKRREGVVVDLEIDTRTKTSV